MDERIRFRQWSPPTRSGHTKLRKAAPGDPPEPTKPKTLMGTGGPQLGGVAGTAGSIIRTGAAAAPKQATSQQGGGLTPGIGKPMTQAAQPGQQMAIPGVASHQQAVAGGSGTQASLPGGARMHTPQGTPAAPKVQTIGQHEASQKPQMPAKGYGVPMSQAAGRTGDQPDIPGVATHQQAMRGGAGTQVEFAGGPRMHTPQLAPKLGSPTTIGQYEAAQQARKLSPSGYGAPMSQAADRPGDQSAIPGVASHQQAMRGGVGTQMELAGGARMHTPQSAPPPTAPKTLGEHAAEQKQKQLEANRPFEGASGQRVLPGVEAYRQKQVAAAGEGGQMGLPLQGGSSPPTRRPQMVTIGQHADAQAQQQQKSPWWGSADSLDPVQSSPPQPSTKQQQADKQANVAVADAGAAQAGLEAQKQKVAGREDQNAIIHRRVAGPNVQGWANFGEGLGHATVSRQGGATSAGMWGDRVVSGVHGLLNRRTPAAAEASRQQREGQIQRQQALRAYRGEMGGVQTKSLDSTPLVRSGTRRSNNG